MSFSKEQEPKQTYFKIEDKIDLVLKMLEKDLEILEKMLRSLGFATNYISVLLTYLVDKLSESQLENFTPPGYGRPIDEKDQYHW